MHISNWWSLWYYKNSSQDERKKEKKELLIKLNGMLTRLVVFYAMMLGNRFFVRSDLHFILFL